MSIINPFSELHNNNTAGNHPAPNVVAALADLAHLAQIGRIFQQMFVSSDSFLRE
jgi:hypothetical protein